MPFEPLTPPPTWQQPIRSYLEQHVIPFHVSALVSGGAVVVVRGRRRIAVTSDNFQLVVGDSVLIARPWPAAVNRLLASQYPFEKFIDVTCAPNASGTFGDLAKELLRKKPRTRYVEGVESLEMFLRRIRQSQEAIGDLMLFTHAWSTGWLAIHLRDPVPGDRPNLHYEQLERVADDNAFKLPAELLIPSRRDKNGKVIRRRFQIRGCRIGLAEPFLNLLKRVLGYTFEVAAPKHWEFLFKTAERDMLEYLKYSFSLLRSAPFTTRQQALTAFAAERFRFIPKAAAQSGTEVPKQMWQRWIPADPNTTASQPHNVRIAFQPGSANLESDYTHTVMDVVTGDLPIGAVAPSPGPNPTEPQKRAAVRAVLSRRYQDNHPFPVWKQWGLPTLDSFINALDVGSTQRGRERPGVEWSQNNVTFDVKTHLFEVRVPIVEPGTEALIANYYPGNPRQAAVEQLKLTDSRLFTIV